MVKEQNKKITEKLTLVKHIAYKRRKAKAGEAKNRIINDYDKRHQNLLNQKREAKPN